MRPENFKKNIDKARVATVYFSVISKDASSLLEKGLKHERSSRNSLVMIMVKVVGDGKEQKAYEGTNLWKIKKKIKDGYEKINSIGTVELLYFK